ncbi:MAG: efflux RND transporter permease subunit [Spirochaetes bacterium]|nr:efflux RND transporter permease subunit [Spirochaetota bacterium]
MSLARTSIDHPVTIVMVFALVCGIAGVFIPRLAVALNPETENPLLSVSTNYSGAGPEDVEQNVTKILEDALSSIEGLKNMSSTSSQGSSNIRLEFGYNVNLDKAQSEIESITRGLLNRLPDGADTPNVRHFDSSAMPIIRLIIQGNRSLEELKTIGEETIQPQLERIKGVATASVSGGSNRIVAVQVSQNRLAAYGLTLTSVANALASQNILLSGGQIVRGSTEYQISTFEKLSSIEEVKGLVIKTIASGGTGKDRVVRLEDVADVKETQDDPSRIIYIDGRRGINIQIVRESDSNAVQISREVHAALAGINKTLPAGVTVEVMSDDTTLVNSTLNEVYNSAWQGIVLTVLILLVFLRNLKATFIIGISIPICILITLLCMYFGGLTLNTISLTGLIFGLGMVVDASIVILDNIFRYRERGAKPRIAAILGTQEMMVAIMGSTLTTLCVFIPIILFRADLGQMGQLFNDLVFTVCFSLAASLIVAVTIVPVLCGPVMHLNTRVQKPLSNPILKKFDDMLEMLFSAQERGYKKALEFCLRNRFLIVALVAVILASAILQLTAFGLNLYPRSNTDDALTVNLNMPLGTTRVRTQAVLEDLQVFVRARVKNYKRLVLSVGSSSSGNSGSLQIMLPDPKDQTDTPSSIKTKLASYIGSVPGASFTYSAGRQFSSGSTVDVQIRSKDQNASLAAAQDIKRIIAGQLPQVENLSISLDQGSPELLIQIDRDRAAMFGFSVSQIAKEIRGSIYGTTAATYDSGGKLIDVIVRLKEEDRRTLSDLKSIFLINSSGNRIPVSNFVTISNSTAPQRINRENKERIIHVQGGLSASSKLTSTEMTQVVQKTLDDNYVSRENVTVSLGGESADVGTYLPVFILIILVAVFLVYGVMASQFESFIDPLIIFISIPLMFIGVVWIYKLTNDSFSLFSMIGIVALAGVVVNNGIVLVDYTNTLRARGIELFEACSEAGRHRLRPILMSTLATLLGIMPLALFPGKGTENIQPIAKTMFGGLLVSSIMTLFLTPVLYHLFNSRGDRKNKKKLRDIDKWYKEEDFPADESREVPGDTD